MRTVTRRYPAGHDEGPVLASTVVMLVARNRARPDPGFAPDAPNLASNRTNRPKRGQTWRDAARGIQAQTRLREDPGAGRRVARHGARPGRSIRRPAASGDTAPLRLPARDRRRAGLLGSAQGPDTRPKAAPDGCPRRGPPDRVPRLRG